MQWYRGENCDVSAELREIVKKKEESTKVSKGIAKEKKEREHEGISL